jgi:hypothetical protein
MDETAKAIKGGRECVSAQFVIPYPPGFPILVPGQVISAEILSSCRRSMCARSMVSGLNWVFASTPRRHSAFRAGKRSMDRADQCAGRARLKRPAVSAKNAVSWQS